MLYINPDQLESGAYGAPQSAEAPGLAQFPEKFLEVFNSTGGFVTMRIIRGIVADVQPDTDAWEAWRADHPEPEPEPGPEPSGDYVKYGELADAIREGVNAV